MRDAGRYSVAEVQFTPGREDFDPRRANAAVLILALAASEEQFRALALRQLDDDGLLIVDFGEIKSFDPEENDWDDELVREAHARLSSEWPVQYGSFYSYPKSGMD